MKKKVFLAGMPGKTMVIAVMAFGMIFTGCGDPNPGPGTGTDPNTADPLQNWTAVGDSTFGSDDYIGVTYVGNKFVAVGGAVPGASSKMAYSVNGETWTAVGDSKIGSGDYIYGITYGGGRFVATGDGGLAYSGRLE
jgi:hypothetical protein